MLRTHSQNKFCVYAQSRAAYKNVKTGVCDLEGTLMNSNQTRRGGRHLCGFSLIELLVVMAVIAILAGLLLPSLSSAQAKGRQVSCLNNLRQLQLAWTMYLGDHNNTMPENKMTGTGLLGCVSTTNSWVTGNAQASADPVLIKQGCIYSYTPNIQVYRCPADRSTVFDASTPRERSYSMDAYLNGGLDVRMYGGFLPGNVIRYSDLLPSPSKIFVLLDETQAIIDDGVFLLYRDPADFWQNGPSHRHSQGANLSFADGHCERWKWRYPNDIQTHGQAVGNDQDRQDLKRLQDALPAMP